MKRRRICWPNPDKVCLQGGCVYCNEGRFRALSTIEVYAENAGLRGDYQYGVENDFFGVDTKP